jgi:hypothetical protein
MNLKGFVQDDNDLKGRFICAGSTTTRNHPLKPRRYSFS